MSRTGNYKQNRLKTHTKGLVTGDRDDPEKWRQDVHRGKQTHDILQEGRGDTGDTNQGGADKLTGIMNYFCSSKYLQLLLKMMKS